MMTTETGTMTKKQTLFGVRQLVQIAVMAAVATVLMYFEFPLPFVAPEFYKLDFSEIPVLIGTFSMGPLAGTIIELLKILMKLCLKGTQTAFVGELGNFLVGCALIIPSGIVYRMRKTRKGALIGMASGTICMAVVGACVNAFLLLPAYAKAYHMDISALVAIGKAVNPAINSVFRFCLLAVAPFNLIKGVLVSLITFLVYKRIRPLIK